MTYDEYASILAINWSTLKAMQLSPLHYHHTLLTPSEDTDALTLGRAFHTATFEPEKYLGEYAIWDGGNRRGKAWDAFVEEHTAQTILTTAQHELAVAMSTAVRSHPVAGPYVSAQGEREVGVTWRDKDTGLDCKARLDLITERAIVDLKSARSIDRRLFGSAAARYGYHGQGAFYHDGLLTARKADRPVALVAVEKAAPFDVGVFVLEPDGALYAGQEVYKELLGRVAECRKSGKWPGRYDREQVLELPRWVFDDGDDDDIADGIAIE